MALSQFFLTSSLLLSLGEQMPLPPDVKDVWIEKKQILQVIEKKQIAYLKAVGQGSSSIKLNNQDYDVLVLSKLQKQLIQNKKLPLGLFFKIDKSQIFLDGLVARPKDLIQILDLTQRNELPFVMRAQMSDEIRKTYLQIINQKLKQEGYASIEIQHNIFYHASLKADEKQKNISQLLRVLGVVTKLSATRLAVEPTIKVEITIAEIKKEFSQKLGLKPPSSYSATVLDDLTTKLDTFKLEVHALENRGMGKILASPNILCRSGKEAEFFAGGEFPIKIVNFSRQDVLWKKYGILLKVKPVADSSGQMSLALETEISSLDMSQVVDGIPGLKTNKVNSHFDLVKSKTIALSGLLREEEGQGSEGLPFLQRIPVLGYLFSSKDYRESRSELVIFVKPTIVEEGEAPVSTSPTHLGAF